MLRKVLKLNLTSWVFVVNSLNSIKITPDSLGILLNMARLTIEINFHSAHILHPHLGVRGGHTKQEKIEQQIFIYLISALL